MPTDLQRSHDELRAAVIIAGRHLARMKFDPKAQIIAEKLRIVLRQARKIRRAREGAEVVTSPK